MFPTIIGILSTHDGYVLFDEIYKKFKSHYSELASKSSNLKKDIFTTLDSGCKFGLINNSSGRFKLALDFNSVEDGQFQTKLQALLHELESLKITRQIDTENLEGSSETTVAPGVRDAGTFGADLQDTPALQPATCRKFTPILNRLWNKTVDCGPGWSRRPLAQRQAIAIHRRQAAEEKIRQRMRAARQRRARSRSRSGTRTRSRSRQRSSRSRSRSRSSRTATRSRKGRC